MIILIYMSAFCMVLEYTTFANTKWSALCCVAAAVLILVADLKYTQLQERIERLEKKGGAE